MPKLTQYTRQLTPDNRINVRRATAEDFGGGVIGQEVGQAFAQVGQEVEGFLQKQKQRKNRIDYLEMQKAFSQERAFLDDQLRKAEAEAAENPEGFTQNFDPIIEQSRQRLFERFQNVSDENRLSLEADFVNLNGNLKARATDFEIRGVAKYQKNIFLETSGNYQNAVRAGTMPAAEAVTKLSEMADRLGLSPEVANTLKQAEVENITLAEARGKLARADTLEEIVSLETEFERMSSAMSPENFNTVLNAVDAARERIKAGDQADAREELADALVVIRDGNDVPGAEALAARAYPDDAEKQARAIEDLTVAKAEGNLRNEIVMASPQQVEQRLNQIDDLIDNPDLSVNERSELIRTRERLTAVENRRQRQLDADSAQYVLDNDITLQDKKLQFDQDRIALQQARDSGADDATVEALTVKAARSRDAFTKQLTAAQARLGRPPKLLTNTEVQQVASIAGSVLDTEDGAMQLRDALVNLRNEYGPKNWGRVYAQLAEEDALYGSHMILGRMVGDPAKNEVATRLAVAVSTKDSDYFDILGDRATKSDVDAQIASALAPLTESLAVQNGIKTSSALIPAVRSYALSLMTSNADMSVADAVEQAATKIVLEDYEFSDSYVVRFPVSKGLDKNKLEQGMNYAIRDLPSLNLRVPINSDMSSREFGLELRQNSTWVTSPYEDGVTLMDRGGRAVEQVLPDGTTDVIRYTWEELEALYNQERDVSLPTSSQRLPAEQIEAERGRD